MSNLSIPMGFDVVWEMERWWVRSERHACMHGMDCGGGVSTYVCMYIIIIVVEECMQL